MMKNNKAPKAIGGVGMPAALMLHEFGSQVWFAFDDIPYHVGSSLSGPKGRWRDVDVRVILDDDKYEAWGLGPPERCLENGKWVALCLAFSALGKQMTGLPIDFQIQQMTEANQKFPTANHMRSGLFVVPLRFTHHGNPKQNEGGDPKGAEPPPTILPTPVK